jgi:holo-[acyl-carrier protein] synthase
VKGSGVRGQGSGIGKLAVGADLIEVRRIDALVEGYGERFTTRVFTPGELAACGGRAESLAARWAAKEAVAKALGTGIGVVAWREIEVLRGENGCPAVRLHGRAQIMADERGLTQWALSLAHDGGMALAFVVAMGG